MALSTRSRLGAAALAGLLVLLCLGSVPGALAHVAVPGAPPRGLPGPAAACTGGGISALINGTLRDQGTARPAPVVPNATVTISFDYETIQSGYHNSSSTTTCLPTLARATVDASGAFGLNLTLPGTTCGRTGCVSYAGPYGPYRFEVSGDTNSPYFLTSELSGHTARLDWVAALNAVTTTPSGFGTYSVGAPVDVVATGLDGEGNASLANVTYGWRLSGTGWTANGSEEAATLVVGDTDSGSTGTATVWVNGSFNGTPVALAPVSVYLTGVATAFAGQSLYPGALDVDTPAAVTLNATGAYGYTYRATLSPGDGGATQNTTCRSVDGPGGIGTVSCGFDLEYPEPGNPTPSATVTNGYSSLTYRFPVVPVSAALSVLAGPSPDRAYVDTPVAVHVDVAGSTGTAPYGPACLVSGDGRFLCDATAGPNWSLSLSYAAVGTYNAIVTVADSAGTNRTVPLPVEIAAHPGITTLALNRSAVTRGGTVTASASVAGGAFPLEYWWNVSDPASTLASGAVDSDAVPPVSFVSGFLATSETIELTVVDALGTRVSNLTVLTVERPVVGVTLRAPQENGTDPAGSPLDLTLVGVDAEDDVVDGFSSGATLSLGAGCGAGWVNDSQGPVDASAGTFPLPTGAWSNTGLDVTVTPRTTGTCEVTIAVTAFAANSSADFPVGPDGLHLHLERPQVVRSSAGNNATLYTLVDRFGNPDPDGYVVVQTRFGNVLEQVQSAVRVGGDGAALVWVNYSSPGPSGTLTVLGESGVAILGPIAIPGLPAPTGVPWWAWLALTAGVLFAAVLGVARVRRRASLAAPEAPTDPDEALRRLAEGRAHVLARLRERPGADLDTIASGFPGPPPDPAELAEWVGTLVTEGLVEPRVDQDGKPRFRLTAPALPPPAPRVEVDAATLDAALAQRDRDAGDEPALPPP